MTLYHKKKKICHLNKTKCLKCNLTQERQDNNLEIKLLLKRSIGEILTKKSMPTAQNLQAHAHHGPTAEFAFDAQQIHFFDVLFVDELWEILVQETNRYARQKNTNMCGKIPVRKNSNALLVFFLDLQSTMSVNWMMPGAQIGLSVTLSLPSFLPEKDFGKFGVSNEYHARLVQ